ncbi:DUF6497 family protein [Roseobacter sp.]|uniref:DUF6497 family protein n=1 Tax=Roseobacter sp. TaxID=1907202 RepID=UPI00385CE5A8
MSLTAKTAFAIDPFAVRALDVPSGQPIQLHDVLIDEVGSESWLRFRFLAPEIARDRGTISFAQAEPDLEHLCTQVALPYMAEFDIEAEIVSVVLLDKPVEFGVSDPEATQFNDVFRVNSGACVWEGI